MSTAVQGLRWLEERQLVVARPKSGYFVSPRRRGTPLPAVSSPPKYSMAIERQSRCDLLHAFDDEASVVSFGAYAPEDRDLFDQEKIRIALARATRVHRQSLVEYNESCGTPALRAAVARRALHLGCQLQPDNIIVTASCTHAVGLCLRAVTKPGDVVVFKRGNSSWQGHVAFFVKDKGALIEVLGGNQSNAVNVKGYQASKLLGIRRAPVADHKTTTNPVVSQKSPEVIHKQSNLQKTQTAQPKNADQNPIKKVRPSAAHSPPAGGQDQLPGSDPRPASC